MLKHIENKEEFINSISSGTVLVDFYADWCGPCKMLAPILEQFAKEAENVEVLKVNVDQVSEVAKDYGIMSIPTLILFKNGEEKDKQVGVMNINQLKAFVK